MDGWIDNFLEAKYKLKEYVNEQYKIKLYLQADFLFVLRRSMDRLKIVIHINSLILNFWLKKKETKA